MAVFTGAELRWSPDSPDTNWSVPFVEDWESMLPLSIQANHPLWQRQLEIYRRAAERYQGSIIPVVPDLHTNMDLLSAIRGPQRLCMDLIDNPELIDRAMSDARAIFRQLWSAVVKAGRMEDFGYCLESHALFSREGSATLQCDFSIMLSLDMQNSWQTARRQPRVLLILVGALALLFWTGSGARWGPTRGCLTIAPAAVGCDRVSNALRTDVRAGSHQWGAIASAASLNFSGLKKIMKKPVKRGEDDVRAIQEAMRAIKRETRQSLEFHLKDYQENLKFRYLFRLAETVAQRLEQAVIQQLQAYSADFGVLAERLGTRQGDKENAAALLADMDQRCRKIGASLARLKESLAGVAAPKA